MSSAAPELVVDSVTGIDVSLAVAGPGARAFAFLIDWHVRTIVALGWYTVGSLIYNGRASLATPLSVDGRWFGAVLAPALAIYFLYHYVLELAMRGTTPGKRAAGVRVVSRDGGTPGAGALLARNVFRLIDSLPLFYGVGLIAAMATREHVRIGDMAAGTLLVYAATGTAFSPTVAAARTEAARLDASGAELLAELLSRWPTLAPEARTRLGRQLLARYGTRTESGGPPDEPALHAELARLAGLEEPLP
ncbi:MAG: RDD family protein [Gammaproteobacteria bacterium]|nr:RDD family protein [Gammaproteobacteria bacterium]